MSVLVDNIPLCLRERPQWVCWKWLEQDGKRRKFPVDAQTGGAASVSDPSTWSSFGQVRRTGS